jgi:hypothetical protein
MALQSRGTLQANHISIGSNRFNFANCYRSRYDLTNTSRDIQPRHVPRDVSQLGDYVNHLPASGTDTNNRAVLRFVASRSEQYTLQVRVKVRANVRICLQRDVRLASSSLLLGHGAPGASCIKSF